MSVVWKDRPEQRTLGLMRLSLCAVLVFLTCVGAGCATPTYSAARTRACLRAAGADVKRSQDAVVTLGFPEIREQIFWHTGGPNDLSTGEFILFTRDAGAASHLVARLLQQFVWEGATRWEAGRLLGSSANAVWVANISEFPSVSPIRWELGLLKRCLK